MVHLSLCGLIFAATLISSSYAHISGANDAANGEKQTLLSENRVPKASATNVAFGSVCDECESIMKRVIIVADDPTKMAELKFLLSALCHETSYEEECKMFVSKLDFIIHELKPFLHDPKRICRELHLCGNPSLDLFHRVGLLYAKKYVNKVDGAADLICEECQFATHELTTNFIDNAAVQSDVRRFLSANVCAHLGNVQGACQLLIDDYLPDLFNELHNLMAEPRQFCAHISLCKSNAKSEKAEERVALAGRGESAGAWRELATRVSARSSPNLPGFSSVGCVTCHLFFGTLLEQLATDETSTAIGADLEKVACPILPKNWNAGCHSFLQLYSPTVVFMTIKQVDQYKLCKAMHICEGETFAKAIAVKQLESVQNIGCTLCNELSHIVEIELASPKMRSRLTSEAAHLVCERAPGGLRAPCDSLVRGFVPLALTRLLQRLQDATLCRAVHACA